MSKKPETKPESKPVPSEPPEIARERKRLERKERVQSAIDKAYQVFVDHALNVDDAGFAISTLTRRVEAAKNSVILQADDRAFPSYRYDFN